MTQKMTLFGAGRMGSAMAAGWLRSDTPPALSVFDPQPGDQIRAWASDGRIRLNPVAAPTDCLVLAIKPQLFAQLKDQILAHIGPSTLVLSIMAGLTMQRLSEALETSNIVRAMPNTPGLIGQGITTYCLPDALPEGAEALVRRCLAPLGQVEGPIPEALMGAATALAGSGPAYIFALTEAMAAAGEAAGFDPARAMRLARATVEGAAALMASSQDTPSTLRANVTSPGGTTQAALQVLMQQDGLPSLMRDAIAAAIGRDRELSEGI